MEQTTPGQIDLIIDERTQLGMGKIVGQLAGRFVSLRAASHHFPDQPACQERFNATNDFFFTAAAGRQQRRVIERAADGRGGLEQLETGLIDPGQTASQQIVHGWGHSPFIRRFVQHRQVLYDEIG